VSTALLLGATGLVGAQIMSLLLADPKVERVVSLGRRKTGTTHKKLEEHAVDLGDAASFQELVHGDFLFSALGTTLKKAGSKDAQRLVDVTYPLNVATVAAENGVRAYGLVSAVGADAGSMMFYNRIKGELERDVQALGFERVRIARPSVLTGERSESRPMEALGASALGALRFIPGLRQYRPISGRVVARALIAAALDSTPGVQFLEPERLFELGDGA
jgi:uncharacterized protein YbjT (DUF2867 family)